MSLLLPAVSHVSTKNIRVVGQNAENAAVESERALSEKKKKYFEADNAIFLGVR